MPSIAEASLSEEERRVVDRLVELLRAELGPDLKAVLLYGSRARGEQPRPDSDVDLLVITRGGQGRDLSRVTRLVSEAADAEGGDPTGFAAHVFDPQWVAGRRAIDSFFMREVDRDRIVLFGEA